MKTMFVCSSSRVNFHAGEEYDSILEVADDISVATIDSWAEKIRSMIAEAATADRVCGCDGRVSVTVDGPSPYWAIVKNLQIIMRAEAGIEVELPQDSPRVVADPETLDLLGKLGERV